MAKTQRGLNCMTTGLTVLQDKVYTIEDYMKLDDGNRYELIRGRLIVVPSPKRRHQDISLNIATVFKNFLKQHPIGTVLWDIDVHLGDKVVRPDILFFSKERSDRIGESYPTAAPDLAIEVLSPSTESYDMKTKSQIYYENGVKEYWIVSPDAKWVEVLVAGEKHWIRTVLDQDDILTTVLLPGLEINLQDVFA